LLGVLTIILAFSGLGLLINNRRGGGKDVAKELDL
jgi:hypothetical protein